MAPPVKACQPAPWTLHGEERGAAQVHGPPIHPPAWEPASAGLAHRPLSPSRDSSTRGRCARALPTVLRARRGDAPGSCSPPHLPPTSPALPCPPLPSEWSLSTPPPRGPHRTASVWSFSSRAPSRRPTSCRSLVPWKPLPRPSHLSTTAPWLLTITVSQLTWNRSATLWPPGVPSLQHRPCLAHALWPGAPPPPLRSPLLPPPFPSPLLGSPLPCAPPCAFPSLPLRVPLPWAPPSPPLHSSEECACRGVCTYEVCVWGVCERGRCAVWACGRGVCVAVGSVPRLRRRWGRWVTATRHQIAGSRRRARV